jgi:hypothetical protein
MLTLLGQPQRFCDGLTRRNFLKIGALSAGTVGAGTFGAGGLTLAEVLRAESVQPAAQQRSIINIYLAGGPSHIDMFDMKPDAPPEIRGEFHPIATNVPGMEICHLMPKLAGMANKFTIIRSLTGLNNEHSPSQTESGWKEFDLKSIGGHPSLGCVVAKVKGPTNGPVPTFVDLSGFSQHGFLGPVYSAFRPDTDGRIDLRLRPEITVDRFHNRAELLKQLDHMRRDIDSSHMMEAMDAFNGRAMGVITSSKLAEALDWEKADPKVHERYGIVQGNDNYRFLLARRLVECGVRVISFSCYSWDTHTENFTTLRRQLPPLDTGLSALINDLDEHGLLATTTIAMWGEFGRSPRIAGGGRDHWPRAASVFIAGGGLRSGQVIGSTNRYGETAQDRPVHFQEVFATFYHQLGIDPKTTTLRDPNGRPQYLVEHPDPIAELIG